MEGGVGRSLIVSPGVFRLVLAGLVLVGHLTRLNLATWAVEIFFLLSGYWVTTVYVSKYQELNRPVASFYLSRYLRLFPIFFLCQALNLAALWGVKDPALSIVSWQWILRLIPIVGSSWQPILLVPAWSLDIEAQFYLAVPVVVFLLGSVPIRFRLWVVWCVGFLSLGFTWSMRSNGLTLLPYAPFFLAGMAQAITPWKPSIRIAIGSLIACCGAIGVVLSVPGFRGLIVGGSHPLDANLLQYNAQLGVVFTALLLPYIFASLTGRSSQRDRSIGNYAYPQYLFHWIPFTIVPKVLGNNVSRLGATGVELVLDLVGCVVLEYFVDRPCERLRRKTLERSV